jgi:hypothetical protein
MSMNQAVVADDKKSLKKNETVGGVTGVIPLHQKRRTQKMNWKIELGARRNYRLLGMCLAELNKGLYRISTSGKGLIHVLASGDVRHITKGAQLAPIIVDTLILQVTKEGKVMGELPTAAHLNAMLSAETFLRQFRPLDQVAKNPLYLSDFSFALPGYQESDEGYLLYIGPGPQVVESMETINRFLDVMDFATNADRTNAVAGALTVLLRNHWPGSKPVVVVTATKSHAGKGTIIEFIRGNVAKADILYESVDWPMQSQLQRQFAQSPNIGVMCLDNVRLDSAGGKGRFIRSGFLESFVTNREISLACPGAGEPARLKNSFVMAITTNDGMLSPDLLNRALPIHLAPKGNVQGRSSPIGNPKLEFLPQNEERIAAELRGMIERWKSCSRPLDDTTKHPMTPWARTIGGILRANGFTDFLANYESRRSLDDPTREALAILASAAPGQELRPGEWADLAVEHGLAKTLFSSSERDTSKGRERCIGVVLSRYLDETFEARTPMKQILVRLEGGLRRWSTGKNPHARYVFTVLEEKALPIEE